MYIGEGGGEGGGRKVYSQGGVSTKSSHGANFRAHADFAKIRTTKFRTSEFFNWHGQL